MTKRAFPVLSFFAFAAISFLGTVLHFVYDFTGQNPISALVSATNESTFEHLKLYFVPALLFAFIERRFRPDREDFWWIKTKSILLGLILIPVIFYTANGAFGKTPDWFNIAIFFLTALITTLYEIRAFHRPERTPPPMFVPVVILSLLGLSFAVFTFLPPDLPLFVDPVNGSRGISLFK